MPFNRALDISDAIADWMVESFVWQRKRDCTPIRMILPTEDFFTAARGETPETARAVLGDVSATSRHVAP